MNKSKLLATAFAAIGLSLSNANADNHMEEMEKCKVFDTDGKNIIKEHKADCGGTNHSCAGQNKVNDPEAWILVPKGQCSKINEGDFSGISKDVMAKLDIPDGK